MKKKRNIFLILFVCLFLSLAVTIRADSGWDGDYDSGSSWDSGGSSWDWGSSSSDHNWGSNRYDRVDSADDLGSAFLIMGCFFVICIVITVVILSTQKGKTNQNNQNRTNNIQYSSTYDINKIKEVIPNFNENEFRAKAFEVYKIIQESWMNFDYDTLKKYTTNELYNLYKSELIALKAKKQKNIMENFSLLNFNIIDMEKGEDNVSIKVRMNIMCNDYVVNQNSNIVRGNKSTVMYNYEMTFTAGLNAKDNKCPNCNAPLENVQTSTCPYCGSTVISDNHDWVLSKKQVISQRR